MLIPPKSTAAVSDFSGSRKGSDDGQVSDKWTSSTNSSMIFSFIAFP